VIYIVGLVVTHSLSNHIASFVCYITESAIYSLNKACTLTLKDNSPKFPCVSDSL
jgi:hypothetical protein